ncbi:transcriptional regulator, ArsR family [Rheinheimera pacifica]|uniref:Transcriptional regulator, ArsR family n=1 Tax=Rheinheimera pacifica TaxID=173990 RepID=A0A1H6J5F2_9GAMM|nr:metalloregulator ArsR/SmtB family transcription factor [Rheinheimera pacifica]SEH57160.1 transcriptional regulator, ArsR family [Rheinheimera pacifica]
MSKKSVIFICTGNSARSQLAEALFRHMAGEQFDVFSAGTAPEPVDPRVFEVLNSRHMSTEHLRSKDLASLSERHFDYAITLCDKARQSCVAQVKAAQILAWDFADPKAKAGTKAFDVVLNELSERIKYFLLFSQKYRAGPEQLGDALSFYKALADDTRLKTLLLIQQQQELCVCELTAALTETQPKISRHLAQLRKAAILQDRRHGQWVFYRLADNLPDWALTVLQLTAENNSDLIADNLSKLNQMGDRPQRAALCS